MLFTLSLLLSKILLTHLLYIEYDYISVIVHLNNGSVLDTAPFVLNDVLCTMGDLYNTNIKYLNVTYYNVKYGYNIYDNLYICIASLFLFFDLYSIFFLIILWLTKNCNQKDVSIYRQLN